LAPFIWIALLFFHPKEDLFLEKKALKKKKMCKFAKKYVREKV
jgi:hypothetical protein